ncbi:MAG TPA: YceI family protein [Gemmatimonadaceae bacterium]|nr:YceI family protein [Gemmatimonadaceae bacterium]
MKAVIRTLIAAGALAGSAMVAGAQMSLPRNLNLTKESRIWLEGTSTVRSFKCNATKVDVAVVAETEQGPAEMVKSASLVVPVAQLDCGNGTMNEHMRKALKAQANPQITWKMTSYTVQGANVVINGTLTIAGKENPIELRGTGTAENSTIRFKGSKQFKMTEYGVKPPSLMLGTMKVGDQITVSFDLVLSE